MKQHNTARHYLTIYSKTFATNSWLRFHFPQWGKEKKKTTKKQAKNKPKQKPNKHHAYLTKNLSTVSTLRRQHICLAALNHHWKTVLSSARDVLQAIWHLAGQREVSGFRCISVYLFDTLIGIHYFSKLISDSFNLIVLI